MPLEVGLLREHADGLLHAIGSDITFEPDGSVIDSMKEADVGARVIASTVRISNKRLIAALCGKPPLPRWEHHPWLHNIGVLVLDARGTATVPTERGSDIHLTYSREVGLRWNT